ncbi:hypothetical protein H6G76_33620 [Nostoc sp. FACHB-152]|uniref:type I restriction-modification enzyme R subunit C-terminal domain-containing protein n=1 Tax=unclassified Nostoc TaxID=2593658 RepID=UPI001689BB60|nr:type I restriction-modification enzyme R subunit C-terminal domain-containing protein [Nostoc sp. FACHB-145]MBD2451971.1 hypothetical protein [Nostoc sp. FACHB-152]MBD2473053.1 hypothetical protein [Nostoc sp. FACHB-145]
MADQAGIYALAPLKRNIPLTDTDLASLEELLFSAEAVESRERFEEVCGKNLNLKLFIRQLVGMDRNAAKEAFGKYLEGSSYNATQIRFVETIIDYLTQNGVMDAGLLYEPPFTDLHYEGLDGVFGSDDADGIVSIVQSFSETVGVA